MPYEVTIPRGLRCFAKGYFAVSNVSVGLPAAALAVPGGRDIEVMIFAETNDIRYSTYGDATTNDFPLRAESFLRVPGMDACSNLRVIRDTADATVRWAAYSMPLVK